MWQHMGRWCVFKKYLLSPFLSLADSITFSSSEVKRLELPNYQIQYGVFLHKNLAYDFWYVSGVVISGRKQFPMPFGDNFDRSVDHFDGGLIVNRIRRPLHPGGPSLCCSHGVFRQHLVI